MPSKILDNRKSKRQKYWVCRVGPFYNRHITKKIDYQLRRALAEVLDRNGELAIGAEIGSYFTNDE